MEEQQLNEQDIIRRHLRNVGRAGGKATVAKYGRGHMQELAKKSAEKRRLNSQKNARPDSPLA